MEQVFRTILVPYDGSSFGMRALRFAARLVGPRGRLVVITVVPAFGNALVQRSFVARARRALSRLVPGARTGRGGPRVDGQVAIGDPYLQIAQAARGVDAIVMCTRGRTGLSHLVIGSVAEKVVRHAPVPVLTFRPGVAVRARARPRRAPDALRPARAARRSRPRR